LHEKERIPVAFFSMLTEHDKRRIENAISSATTTDQVRRLESALQTGDMSSVSDIIPQDILSSLWDQSKEESLIKPIQPVKQAVNVAVPSRKTTREEAEEETAKRRYTESIQLSSVLLDKILPLVKKDTHHSNITNQARKISPTSDWVKTYPNSEGKKKVLVIECATGLCMHDGQYIHNVLVRFLVADFLTENLLLDMDISLPEGYQPADLRPSQTGIDESAALNSSSHSTSYRTARERILEMISSETLIICSDAVRCSAALRLDHPNWLSIGDIFKVDPVKKKQAEGKFYVRHNLTCNQIIEGYLGEQIEERVKHLPLRSRLIETLLGLIRLAKSVARKGITQVPVLVDLPRRLNTVLMTHIPSDWTVDDGVGAIFPSAVEIEPIDFFLDTHTNEWRGETLVKFRNEAEMRKAFDALTTCTDIFVGWEWKACGRVTEESLKSLGEDFGPVVAVRIQDIYKQYRTSSPGKEESRPFGFISLARYQDALKMAEEPRQIEKDGASFHVKISRKPITAFKRVPLGENGEDFVEAFIM
jgi:hypothetical protein